MTPSHDHAAPQMSWDAFAALAETYGADLKRWPLAEHAAAQALCAMDPERAEGLLAAERDLDLLLAFAPAPPPSQVLREAVLAGAHAPRPLIVIDVAWLRWCVRQPVLSGAAALAVCAGLLVGATLSGGALTSARQEALAGAVQPDLAAGLEPGALQPHAAGPT